MIDATVKLIDRLIQLLTIRERNREKYFNNFVEPMYKDAEMIVKDYMALFVELISRLESEEEVPEVIKWIEERRMTLLPLRIKVRAFLNNHAIKSMEESMDKFQKGTWGLMKGGLSLVQQGYVQLEEYGWCDHTVLDLLYIYAHEPLSSNRDRYVFHARQQLAAIEMAWQDVVAGYAEIKRTKLS